MWLNADVGEGWPDNDAALIPHLDLVNIACGGHAGDDNSVRHTAAMAVAENVRIGAHPSYPDRHAFGRHSYADQLSRNDLYACLYEQVALCTKHCAGLGSELHHIKAHGALYNDSNDRVDIMQVLIDLAAEFNTRLMIQAMPKSKPHFAQILSEIEKKNIIVLLEGFADRRYEPDGKLRSREYADALLNSVDAIKDQALNFIEYTRVKTSDTQWLNLKVDSLCVHGDNPLSLAAVKSIRAETN